MFRLTYKVFETRINLFLIGFIHMVGVSGRERIPLVDGLHWLVDGLAAVAKAFKMIYGVQVKLCEALVECFGFRVGAAFRSFRASKVES